MRDALIGLRKHRLITQQQDHHWDVVDLLYQWCSSKNLGSARSAAQKTYFWATT
jgi:hypothetical protein